MPWKPPEDASDGETWHGPSKIVPLRVDLLAGTRLAGYSIGRVIGRGGMGVVYSAKHLHLDRDVAIKVLPPELHESGDFRDRFLRESRTAASISHPNIIAVYDAGEADDLLYIAMQYVDGSDLGELLDREGPLEPRRALGLLRQVAAALDVAHRHGIVHRDVKPANVLIDSAHCYLTDFGLATGASAPALTAKGQFVGTVHYMAPEQIRGAGVDARTDVYALGCLAYHALAGKVPFERDSEVAEVYAHLEDPPQALSAERPDLPPALDAAISAALAKKKEDRPSSCGELVAALEAALDGAAAGTEPSVQSSPLATLIVVAEDPRTRALVRASVKSASLRVLERPGTQTLSALVERERPELVVIDWEEMGAAASELCRALRETPRGAHTRVLALVGRAQGAGSEAVQGGADDYVVKPFSPLQVLYKVRDLGGEDLVRSDR